MKKKLAVASLLVASIMYFGVRTTNNNLATETIVQKVRTSFESVFIAAYNVLSDKPFPTAAQHEAQYEREYHYTVKEIPVGNIQKTTDNSPVRDIKAIKSPLPLQEYLIQNTPN